MRIERSMIDEMVAHARDEAPNECCGIIGAVDGRATRLYRATNAEASPLRYSLDSADLLRITREVEARGEELAAIYHSHTQSPAYPSQTDVNLASYPDALYVIVSLETPDSPDVRAFTIRDGVIEPAGLVIE